MHTYNHLFFSKKDQPFTVTPRDDLELYLKTCMILDCRRKPKCPKKPDTCMWNI